MAKSQQQRQRNRQRKLERRRRNNKLQREKQPLMRAPATKLSHRLATKLARACTLIE